MENKNELIEIQRLLKKQMHRLDEAVASEVKIEIGRSGGMSQNAQAYLKAVATSLRVKDMTHKNPASEKTILTEIGVINDQD